MVLTSKETDLELLTLTTMQGRLRIFALSVLLLVGFAEPLRAQRQTERLNRGLVALPSGASDVFLSWRLLEKDSKEIGFHVYRHADGDEPLKLTRKPIADSTSFVDRGALTRSTAYRYSVSVVVEGEEKPRSSAVKIWKPGYLSIPIDTLPSYRPGDASIGDLDGDGEFEIVLHQVSRPRDNSHAGLTGSPILDAYKLDGTKLWRIDLGKNVREGEHYTQFIVYDLDGDGSAELACKTADGTIDGQGKIIGDAEKDWRTKDESSRSFGRVLAGPEYFTIFDGRTGAALKTVDYQPNRKPIDGWGGIGGNGGNDSYGNRCDRFLACVAFLDGKRPSVVTCRGVYGRTVLVAWDWRDGKLTRRWIFDTGTSYPPYTDASKFSGMGGHSLSVGDVDGDGRDEIVYQAMVVDDDGKGLYSTGLRHGDSMHLSDLDPNRPGQEVFTVQENEDRTVKLGTPGAALRDAKTGALLWSHSPGVDVGAGMAADIDPRYEGCEFWGGPGGLRNVRGESVGPAPRSKAWVIWWDGDLLRELWAGGRVRRWNWKRGVEESVFASETVRRLRHPTLLGDLIGDWREEFIVPAPDGRSLRLYSTTHPTKHRLRCLLLDSQYRLGIAWQNVVYNKPAHPSFFIGHTPQKSAAAEGAQLDGEP